MVCTLGYGLASSLLNSNTSDICPMNLMTVSLQKSQHFHGPVTVHCCRPKQEIQNSNTFLIPVDCSHNFSCWQCILKFFSLFGMLYGTIPPIATWIKVQNGGPTFHPMWKSVAGSHQRLYHINTNDKCWLLPLSLCVHVSMHGTKQVQTLEHLSCAHHCESQSKGWLMKWHHMTTPRMKRIKSVLSVGKIIATVFRDEKGVIFFNFFPRGHQQTTTTTVKC